MIDHSTYVGASLARRLMFALIFAVTGIIVVTSLWFYLDSVKSETERFEEKVHQASLYLQGALRLPLWNINEQAVSLVCQAILEDPLISAIEVRDSDGQVLFKQQKTATEDDVLKSFETILYKNVVVGSVEIQSSLKEAHTPATEMLWAIGVVSSAVLLVISFCTVFLIRYFLNQPLRQLTHVAESFGSNSKESAISLTKSYSEFQPLLQVLEGMKHQIDGQMKEVQESSEKFLAIFSGVNEGIFLHDAQTGEILMANPRVSEMYGYSVDAIRRLTVGELSSGVPPSTDEKARELIALAREEDVPIFEWEARHQDGHFFWTEASMRHVWIGGEERILVSVRDISERKQTQDALVKSEGRFRTLVEAAQSMILVLSPEGHIMEINPYAERVLKCRREEVLGQDFIESYLPHDLRQAIRNDMARMLQSDMSMIFESSVLTSDRPLEYFWTLSRLQDDEGTVYGALAIGQDITHKQELDRLKSEFIAIAAHELNTPLTAVIGFAEVLLGNDSHAPEERREFLSIILNKALVLERIVAEFLNLSRVESGRLIHIEKKEFDLSSVVKRCVDAYIKEYPQFSFVLNLPEGKTTICADPYKVEQVMENLLSNAVKFSSEGSSITVSCQKHKEMLQVSVNDQGIGMSPEQRVHCFEKFYRADSSNVSRPGLGLGLPIVKSIIEAHGGEIGVESQSGKGTTVTFSLPIDNSDTTEQE